MRKRPVTYPVKTSRPQLLFALSQSGQICEIKAQDSRSPSFLLAFLAFLAVSAYQEANFRC
jgi:hypothetical protein